MNKKAQPVKQSTKPATQTTNIAEEIAAPTSFFGRMKQMLSSTIGDATLARRFFGVYRQLTIPMLKFSIHAHQTPLFEQLGIQALRIAVQATKQKHIHNSPGYYSGVLRELMDKSLFSDAFQDYDIPVGRLYFP